MKIQTKVKVLCVIIRVVLSCSFAALTATKIHEFLQEETGDSVRKEMRNVDIPTINLCFYHDDFLMEQLEKMSADNFIAYTDFAMSNKGGYFTKEILETQEHWTQETFYVTYSNPLKMYPCFYLNPPSLSIKHQEYARVSQCNMKSGTSQ